jgi:hypothetical protein
MEGGWDPVTIAETWTVTDTVEAVRALSFHSVLEWARSPKPKE